MEILLQMVGVAVPSVTALGGLFAWGVRRMDRRFEEARVERERLEGRVAGLETRMERLEVRVAELETRMERLERRVERGFEEARQDRARIEVQLGERSGRIEERIDRVAEQVGGQISGLNRELGKLQGFTGAAQVQALASSQESWNWPRTGCAGAPAGCRRRRPERRAGRKAGVHLDACR